MKRLIIILSIIILILMFSYLGSDFITLHNYVQQTRVSKLLVYWVVVILIVPSTIVFQTLIHSRYLSPNILGVDTIYVFLQSFFYYVGFRLFNLSTLNSMTGYFLQISTMLGLFYMILTLTKVDWTSKVRESVWLMTGLIFGTVLRNFSTFFQVLLDPNEYTRLQSQLMPSFQRVNTMILIIAVITAVSGMFYFITKRYVLDVYHLGRDMAITLGIDIARETRRLLLIIIWMIGTATALVGPLTFLGFMVANLTYVVTSRHHHTARFVVGILLGVMFVLGGQLFIERIVNYQYNLAMIIEGIGGVMFFILLWHSAKKAPSVGKE